MYRKDGPHHCEKFTIGCGVTPLHIRERSRRKSNRRPGRWVFFVMLLQKRHAYLVSRRVCVEEEGSVRNQKFQDRSLHQVVTAVPSGPNVLPNASIQGFVHVAEVLDEAKLYVTRAEELTELCKVFREAHSRKSRQWHPWRSRFDLEAELGRNSPSVFIRTEICGYSATNRRYLAA